MASLTNSVTSVGVFLLMLIAVSQIMKFYNVGQEIYYPYLIFYVMMLLCYLFLPSHDETIKIKT